MAQYKKVIYETCMIGGTNTDRFQTQVNDRISTWQARGYEVDVQFAASNAQAIAFMTKYKMEPVV